MTNKLNKSEIEKMYRAGSSIRELAELTNRTYEAMKKYIQRNFKDITNEKNKKIHSANERIIKMYTAGAEIKDIAKVTGRSIKAIHHYVERYAKEYKEERNENKKYIKEVNGLLDKEVKRQICDSSFLKYNRQAYKTVDNILIYDTKRNGTRTHDVPKAFQLIENQ